MSLLWDSLWHFRRKHYGHLEGNDSHFCTLWFISYSHSQEIPQSKHVKCEYFSIITFKTVIFQRMVYFRLKVAALVFVIDVFLLNSSSKREFCRSSSGIKYKSVFTFWVVRTRSRTWGHDLRWELYDKACRPVFTHDTSSTYLLPRLSTSLHPSSGRLGQEKPVQSSGSQGHRQG